MRLVSVSVDAPEVNAAFRAGLGARWTFLSDPERTVQAQLGLRETTDTRHHPYVPRVFTLSPDGLRVHAVVRRLLVLGARDAGGAAAGPARHPAHAARRLRRARGVSWAWLAIVDARPADADAAASLRTLAGEPAGVLAAWLRHAKPVRHARRADARIVDPEGGSARISLVLPPAGVQARVRRPCRPAGASRPACARAVRRGHDAPHGRLALRRLAARRARRARRPPRRRPVRARLPRARAARRRGRARARAVAGGAGDRALRQRAAVARRPVRVTPARLPRQNRRPLLTTPLGGPHAGPSPALPRAAAPARPRHRCPRRRRAGRDGHERGVLYTQTNDPAGNTVQRFDRAADGSLTPAGTFATGGAGLATLGGRQGAVALSDDGRNLYAVNAGSDSVTAFRVGRHRTSLLGTVPSGGVAPVSIDEDRGRVYVLNSGGTPNVTAFAAASTAR